MRAIGSILVLLLALANIMGAIPEAWGALMAGTYSISESRILLWHCGVKVVYSIILLALGIAALVAQRRIFGAMTVAWACAAFSVTWFFSIDLVQHRLIGALTICGGMLMLCSQQSTMSAER